MSARITYPVGAVIKVVAQALKSIVDQIPIVISLDQFSIEALSPDKVSMILFSIPSVAFEEYSVSEEVRIIADRDEFVKSLRRASKRDKVTFEYMAGGRELKVRVFNVRNNVEREYAVPLSEVSFDRIGSINVELEVSANLPSSELVSIIKDVSIVGEEMSLIYSSELNGIKVVAHGDLGSYETVLKQFHPLTYLESTVSNTIAKYSVEHLKAIAKLLNLADECSISFGSDKPLKISFEITGGSKVEIWVAPRT
ncbi:hypothetical protein QPL79_01115 [Ignisphaera sp. 4213-co]|uniref:DNA polymerase sliding clamp n=1 Tax=Ignisphaera cupida TaxID=3050454 RepID=A0ABD4Z3S1_9CREN|nr:hypothetical protein [Ignisphaera sp. 4213-co]MDK6027966.1 hypothetical protein [Ignisphaera sp. 4213-co]